MNRRGAVLTMGLVAMAPIVFGCTRNTNEVVVYVAIDRSRAETILNRFQNSSGIKVRAVYDAEAAKTTGLVARLLTEADHPRCDVFWNNELAQTCLLAQAGVLAAYESPAAQDIPTHGKPESGLWTPVATRARVIVYNSKHLAPAEVPRSIFELADPKWRGKVAIANPQFGTTKAHIAALFATIGSNRAQQFLGELLANDVQIVDGNAMVKNLVARHDESSGGVLIGLTDTDDVREGQAANEPVEMILPDQDTIGTFLCPCTVCLIEQAPHPATARALVDYLVSADVESMLCGQASGYMAIRGGTIGAGQEGESTPRWFDISDQQLLDKLEESSRWTLEHFHR
jgi:iron(III) transport system substrate-binding protein